MVEAYKYTDGNGQAGDASGEAASAFPEGGDHTAAGRAAGNGECTAVCGAGL